MSEKPKPTSAETTSSEAPKSPEAPKTTENKFASSAEFVKKQLEDREAITDEEKRKNFDANWRRLGGDAVEAALAKVKDNPDDENAKKELQQAFDFAHESYQNQTNEFRHASKEDLADAREMVAAELATFNDDTFFEQVAKLRQELMSDGGITRSQADKLINEASLVGTETSADPAGTPASSKDGTERKGGKASESSEGPEGGTERDEEKQLGVWGNVKAAYGGAFKTLFSRMPRKRDFEGKEEYKMERSKALRRKLGATAFIGANVAVIGIAAKGVGAFDAAHDMISNITGEGLDTDPSIIVDGEVGTEDLSAGSLESSIDDVELEPLEDENVGVLEGMFGLSPEEMIEQSKADELSHIENPDKVYANDFDYISPEDLINSPETADMFPGYDALMDQFEASPTELAGHLYKFNEVNGMELSPELAVLDGESFTEYADRMGELMHGNEDLQQQGIDTMMDYLIDNNVELQDMPSEYASGHVIMEDGKPAVGWDEYVATLDPNDKILIAPGDTVGIRLPCGQPVEIFPEVESVLQGTAQPQVHSAFEPVAYQTDFTPQGGGTSPAETVTTPTGGGGIPTGEVTPPPYVPEAPGEPELPVVPSVDDSKNWNLIPDEDGWTFDDTLYEQTEDPSIVGNGTQSPNLDPSTPIGSEAEGAAVPEAAVGTGGTREDLGVGNQGAGAAGADLGQSYESATDTATVETGATTDDNAGTETANPFN